MVAKEYCWVMTLAVKLSCCGRSDSGVLEYGFQLDSVCVCVRTRALACECMRALKSNFLKIRLAPDILGRNYPVTTLLHQSGRVCKYTHACMHARTYFHPSGNICVLVGV